MTRVLSVRLCFLLVVQHSNNKKRFEMFDRPCCHKNGLIPFSSEGITRR